MASKRDQLQAYQFLVQRAISALVTRETDPEQPPFRRPSGAAFASIALAIVSLAGVGVYGMIVPGGNSSWKSASEVIVEKETGTRYVYLNDKLYPVANYASALLLLGQHASTEVVSGNSLAGVPRGPRIGIEDAPDSLPDTKRLLTGAWSLCSAPASDVSGSQIEQSVLLAGTDPSGGSGLGDQGLLVQLVSTGDRYLIWHGYRHRIDDYDTVGTGLTLATEPWARVDQAWLNVLPEGAPIGPLSIEQAGEPSTAVPGRADILTGMLLMVQASGGGQQYYVAEHDALRPITELQYDVQLASSQLMSAAYPGGVPKAMSLAPAQAAAAKQLEPVAAAENSAPPARPAIARLTDGEATVCATFDPGKSSPRLVVGPTLPDAATVTSRRTAEGTPLADRVYVPPGSAAVVESMPSSQSPSGTYVLVTDMGRRYSLSSPDVLKTFGYSTTNAVQLPATLVSRLPEGPGLDPDTAKSQTVKS
ncbi:type VII secretion protein EccB [Amycolatopsis acidicola]|uniref:Type VII secretion protein EccB n=1 Tax=Amycolatopsis acidicola TaxID=2596893 RepID=A0A5N0UZZ1_9PSEU|nr:type VII secretion protein EccB [Amycolatopsis acidicola]KAA9155801.1 type VII secretion protein EccB [Amycolatopsis acidicola]